jgi:hypothetical protein
VQKVVQEGKSFSHTLTAALQQSSISCLSLADLGQICLLAFCAQSKPYTAVDIALRLMSIQKLFVNTFVDIFAFDVNTKAVCQYIQSVQLNFALFIHPFASFSRTNFCLPPA